MADYTPTTDEMRIMHTNNYDDWEEAKIAGIRFDRWLAAHDDKIRAEGQAEAWDKGHETWWDRGPDDCRCDVTHWDDCGCGLFDTGILLSLAKNPYRVIKSEEAST